MSDGAVLQLPDGRTKTVRASETKIGDLLLEYPGCEIEEGGYAQISQDLQLKAGRTYVITLAKSSGDDKGINLLHYPSSGQNRISSEPSQQGMGNRAVKYHITVKGQGVCCATFGQNQHIGAKSSK